MNGQLRILLNPTLTAIAETYQKLINLGTEDIMEKTSTSTIMTFKKIIIILYFYTGKGKIDFKLTIPSKYFS